ncbi:uncharacterized protein LOC110065647 [Orbicella faveolata]|uniref:uncharacterized protein LOC110065647 n=1 Tax=Orbicella faveolata TaxID=48498 RepID=UPI0009E4A6E7|nr:uncharacterized protein LOC110065647 [Orbicella faveolata]
MKTIISVVILAVLIVAVTSRIPRYHHKLSDDGPRYNNRRSDGGPSYQYKLADKRERMNHFDVREDSKEANYFLKPREPCNEICYENCHEEARGNNQIPRCNHCGSDC